jgi:hypothetical protein
VSSIAADVAVLVFVGMVFCTKCASNETRLLGDSPLWVSSVWRYGGEDGSGVYVDTEAL